VAEGQSLEEAGIPGCLGGVWAHIDGSGTAGATQRQGIFFVELDGVDGR
jgi:hypothetical protein